MKDFLCEAFSIFRYCRRSLGGTWYQVYEEYDDLLGSRSATIYWTREKLVEINLPTWERQIQKTETFNPAVD